MKLYAIIGAGGFGRDVAPLVSHMLSKESSPYEIVFVDENTTYAKTINSYQVLNLSEFFSHPASQKFFNIAIANSKLRERFANIMLDKGFKPFRINALNFLELDNNYIAEGAIFCPFSIVTSNTKIGKYFHANIFSYVEHDCIIGDYVTFAPNVHCNGNIIIEDHVYVGAGAIIKQGKAGDPMIIGKGAVIGMGAIITKPVASFTTVVGNPARVLYKNSNQPIKEV